MPGLDVDVFILCGGLGTRLGAAAKGLPKPMVDAGGRPFLQLLIDDARRQGARRFVLCAGYLAEAMEGKLEAPGAELAFSVEAQPLGTGGALKQAAGFCRERSLLLMNGDSCCEGLDLRGLLEFHHERGGLGAVAAVAADGRGDVGLMRTGPGSRIVSFVEKGGGRPGKGDVVNAGVYVFDRRLFDLIGPGRSSLEADILPSVLPEGLYAFPAPGPLWDIGTPERLEAFRTSRRQRPAR